ILGSNRASGETGTFSGTGITVNSVSGGGASLTVNVTVATGAAVGARNVTVNNNDGSSATLVAGFTVNAGPTVTSVTPTSRAQGTTNQNLTVVGTNFQVGVAVSFSGTGITVNSTTWNSATNLTVNVSIAPAAPTGARSATAVNPDVGTGTKTNAFTVNAAPTITSVTPSSRGQGATNQNVVIN